MRLLNTKMSLLLAILALTGCTSADKKVDDIAGQAGTTASDAATNAYGDNTAVDGAEIKGIGTGPDGVFMEGSLMGSNAELMGGEFADPKHPLSIQIIYFLYDSSQIRPEFAKIIAAHAQYLVAHPEQKVKLEGHADERGSPEYNIALSEQRAKAVSRALQRQGVSSSQLELISYGEEKPAIAKHTQEAWEKNRRVEIVYQARQ